MGVTQSGGSRYESGRTIPKPILLLFPIVHGDDKEAQAQYTKVRAEAAKAPLAQRISQ